MIFFLGIGKCCIETPQVIVLSEYFDKKKELANSFRVAGNPLGGAVIPFVLVLLFNYYGVQLSFIILSGILLQLLVLVFLIRPYKTHQIIVYNTEIRKKKKLAASAGEVDPFKSSTQPQQPKSKAKRIDIKLLKNPLYLTHVGMMFFFSIAVPQVQYFVPIFGKSIGLTPTENSIVLAYQSVSDSAIRLLLGALLDRKFFKKTHAFVFW